MIPPGCRRVGGPQAHRAEVLPAALRGIRESGEKVRPPRYRREILEAMGVPAGKIKGQVLRHLSIQAHGPAGVVGLIVGKLPAAVLPCHIHRVPDGTQPPAALRALPEGLVRSELCPNAAPRRPVSLPRDDVDHGRESIGSVEGAGGSQDDLNSLHPLRREVGEVEDAVGRAVDPHPVDQDEGVVGIPAPREDARHRARRARLHHAERRHGAERLAHRVHPEPLQVLPGDYGHIRRRLGDILRDPRGGDDHLLQRLLRLGRRLLAGRPGCPEDEAQDDQECPSGLSCPHNPPSFPRGGESCSPERSPDSWIVAPPRLPIPTRAIRAPIAYRPFGRQWVPGNSAIRKNVRRFCLIVWVPECRIAPPGTVAICGIAPHSQWRDRAGFLPLPSEPTGTQERPASLTSGECCDAVPCASRWFRMPWTRGRPEAGCRSTVTGQP